MTITGNHPKPVKEKRRKQPPKRRPARNELRDTRAMHWIVTKLNESSLECHVKHIVEADRYYNYAERRYASMPMYKNRRVHTNIEGVAKDGRAIFLQLQKVGVKQFCKHRASFMCEMEKKGAIVGVIFDFYDAWDVVSSSEKRKTRTYFYREKHGKTEESTSPEIGNENPGN